MSPAFHWIWGRAGGRQGAGAGIEKALVARLTGPWPPGVASGSFSWNERRPMTITVAEICRYPVKGLNAERLARVTLIPKVLSNDP